MTYSWAWTDALFIASLVVLDGATALTGTPEDVLAVTLGVFIGFAAGMSALARAYRPQIRAVQAAALAELEHCAQLQDRLTTIEQLLETQKGINNGRPRGETAGRLADLDGPGVGDREP